MKIIATKIPEVLIIEPQVFGDDRGFFFESFNAKSWQEKTGLNINFVQDNHSRSQQNVLRGLHYQIQQPQGKLVRAVVGEILDIAVDIRKSSPTFGQWIGEVLTAENKKQLWIPEGFAHGFLVLSENAEVLYKTNNFYAPEYDRSIRWNDPDITINWNLKITPLLSNKDKNAPLLKDAEIYD
ncbi:MAG: dTDP-4-dehydrorhamnose 3,5-epimerase [Cyanobacteria bacterium]|nr:dTDP-4-dehydrorhamnose 3,5-epimerase [Cyanobacteria bacterium CG_2015-16_32_12]NCO77662.1 dTDP-4-dehydrorhamnose 3,5-epimerase [Cyanobacteria bacterium CG_2015-22_32_23]NCQ04106.1 dTDP-4-dehydrorhamnose 3,5-epimerase [Cyanobacteria bacterium CG_2015-09_32_10]NCQ41485.1 dTDP-4-dehydrorhamnose 3,5-epimerase [Cyanobacteria bacterium CG_2015-04_32_10]NCS85921.1 dTDP-4-dehydrorhamnose 3,5-epimerase [Cyanobacteria bacterium CG_2015-02_32_10]